MKIARNTQKILNNRDQIFQLPPALLQTMHKRMHLDTIRPRILRLHTKNLLGTSLHVNCHFTYLNTEILKSC